MKNQTRRQALEWWSKLPKDTRQQSKLNLCWIYFDIGRNPSSLTGREIEKIWRKEHPNLIKDADELSNLMDDTFESKPNQKQFKEFNPELFKAYINKFSDKDKVKALNILLLQDNIGLQINAEVKDGGKYSEMSIVEIIPMIIKYIDNTLIGKTMDKIYCYYKK